MKKQNNTSSRNKAFKAANINHWASLTLTYTQYFYSDDKKLTDTKFTIEDTSQIHLLNPISASQEELLSTVWMSKHTRLYATESNKLKDLFNLLIEFDQPESIKQKLYPTSGITKIGNTHYYLLPTGAISSGEVDYDLRSMNNTLEGSELLKAKKTTSKRLKQYTDLLSRTHSNGNLFVAYAKIMSPLLDIFMHNEFSIMTIGPTGSGKSFSDKIIRMANGYRFRHGTNRKPQLLTSAGSVTENRLLELLGSGYGLTVFIDDFNSSSNLSMDTIIRTASDGSNRSVHSSSNTKYFDSTSTLIINGEEAYADLIPSAESRLVITEHHSPEQSEEFRSKTLELAMSENSFKAAMTSGLAAIRYAIKHAKKPKSLHKRRVKLINKFAKELPTNLHSRLLQNMANMLVSAECFIELLLNHNALTKKEADTQKKEAFNFYRDLANAQSKHWAKLSISDELADDLRTKLLTGNFYVTKYKSMEAPFVDKLCGWNNGGPQGEWLGFIENGSLAISAFNFNIAKPTKKSMVNDGTLISYKEPKSGKERFTKRKTLTYARDLPAQSCSKGFLVMSAGFTNQVFKGQ